ncbi:MAG: sigma-70 family RNA polymerase sigma factor [Bdellovibrionota bacterium]|nr:MAG: sigma-70 family RNA polymerase sigma factor [Bdellovibrionota bacterium]
MPSNNHLSSPNVASLPSSGLPTPPEPDRLSLLGLTPHPPRSGADAISEGEEPGLPGELAAIDAEYTLSKAELNRILAKLGDAAPLWQAYWEDRSGENHSRLCEHYRPWVEGIAGRVAQKVPNEVDPEDLAQEGMLALIEHLPLFERERDVKFESFVGPRIVGAMKDSLRALDWVPRITRFRAGRVREAQERHQEVTGMTPTECELREALGLDEEMFAKYRAACLGPSNPKTVGDFRSRDDKEGGSLDELNIRPKHPGKDSKLETQEVIEKLLSLLDQRKQGMLRAYLSGEGTLREIGAPWGLVESRVSQLFQEILTELAAHVSRGAFSEIGSLFEALCAEYGTVRSVAPSGETAMSDDFAQSLDRANSKAPAAYNLGTDGESYTSGLSDQSFRGLIAKVAATHKPPSSEPQPQDGFVFSDDKAAEPIEE